jgi:hypothetical protein
MKFKAHYLDRVIYGLFGILAIAVLLWAYRWYFSPADKCLDGGGSISRDGICIH